MPADAFADGQPPLSMAPMMFAANQAHAEQAVQAARAIFGRTLATWASDLLTVQSRGLHIAAWDPTQALTASDSPHGLRKAA